jgi:hypothetical protein
VRHKRLCKLKFCVLALALSQLFCSAQPGAENNPLQQSPDVDPTCQENGCLQGVWFIGDYSKDYLSAFLDDGVMIDNGYALWRLQYFTDGRQASATLTIPLAASNNLDGYAVVINNPGTVGLADRCAPGRSVLGLAGYFGARGFVGVAPDYPGLGTPGVHPYLVSTVEGRASLDAARATLSLLDLLGVAHRSGLAFTGLSQGGHATLAAAQAQPSYAPELNVKAFAVVSPANVFVEHWASSIPYDGAHLVFHALLTYAWADYYGFAGEGIWAEALQGDIDDIMGNSCLVDVDEPTLADRLGTERSAIFDEEFSSAFATQNLSTYPFLEEGFAYNRLLPYNHVAPLRIYQGDADEIIPQSSTDDLVTVLQSGTGEVDYRVVSGGGHTDIAFNVLALKQSASEEIISWLKARVSAED